MHLCGCVSVSVFVATTWHTENVIKVNVFVDFKRFEFPVSLLQD